MVSLLCHVPHYFHIWMGKKYFFSCFVFIYLYLFLLNILPLSICIIFICILVLCTVDLTKDPGVSLQIENLNSDSYCEISINSEVKEKINVAAGSIAKLSFLDCPNEDIRLTAKKVIGESSHS